MYQPTLFKQMWIQKPTIHTIQEVQVITHVVDVNMLEEEVEADPTTTSQLEIDQLVNFATSMDMQ